MKIKNGRIFLDETDRRIIDILRENSKLTYTEIGRRLGIAHSTVYERIRKLEDSGVIAKYTAVIDMNKLGFKPIMAVVTIYTEPRESENIAKKLADMENVLEVFMSLSEEILIIAKVVAEDQEKLHSIIAKSFAPLPGVLKIRTSMITRVVKDSSGYMP